jgi:uncharacterized protein (TIGR00252 family)
MGNAAEDAACAWLQAEGYMVRERNWKTRFCEVDIIAEKNAAVYFVEVKHRSSERQGGGISALTARKLRQMRFAATLYLSRQPSGTDARLAGIVTSGRENPMVIEFLELE